MSQDLKKLYEDNADFRRYVDMCCANDVHHKAATIDDVLSRAITRGVAEMYQSNAAKLSGIIKSTFTPQGECV